MKTTRLVRRGLAWTAAGLGLAIAGYGASVAAAWFRYGRPPAAPDDAERDGLLDRVMPECDVAERHHIRVRAPAEAAFAAAANADLQQSPIVRAIIRAREMFLCASPGTRATPHGLLAETQALGWRILAEEPGREVVVGAVTRPWLGNVVFRGLPLEEFLAFDEPGYVKIAWTLRADPSGRDASVFRTETRVRPTDPVARRKFRWYWARFSPGILLIRMALLRDLKREAEARAGVR